MRLAALLALSLVATPALADTADTDLLNRLSGSWAGKGTLRDGPAAAPDAIECTLEAATNGGTLTISGQCSGAAKGAKMAGELRWSEGPGIYVGRLQGASLSGTRSLSGKRQGDSLILRISGDAQASNLAMQLSGENAVRLTVSDKANVTLLDLPLTKR